MEILTIICDLELHPKVKILENDVQSDLISLLTTEDLIQSPLIPVTSFGSIVVVLYDSNKVVNGKTPGN